MALRPLSKPMFKKFETPGEKLEGNYEGFDMREYEEKPYQSHKIRTPQGLVRISGANLDYQLKDAGLGDYLVITYTGLVSKKTKQGKSFKQKEFTIEVDDEKSIVVDSSESAPTSSRQEKQLA